MAVSNGRHTKFMILMVKNSKNSKPFESYKKRPNLDQKTLPKSNNHEENQQKRRKTKEKKALLRVLEEHLNVAQVVYNFNIFM